jgi:hypothetical protein
MTTRKQRGEQGLEAVCHQHDILLSPSVTSFAERIKEETQDLAMESFGVGAFSQSHGSRLSAHILLENSLQRSAILSAIST